MSELKEINETLKFIADILKHLVLQLSIMNEKLENLETVEIKKYRKM